MSFSVLQIYKKFSDLLLKKSKKIVVLAQKIFFLTKKQRILLFPQYKFHLPFSLLQSLKYMNISCL